MATQIWIPAYAGMTITKESGMAVSKLNSAIHTTVDVAIIGTGFAGLGMAMQLKEAGMNDFLLLEKAGATTITQAVPAMCRAISIRSPSRRTQNGRGCSRRSLKSSSI